MSSYPGRGLLLAFCVFYSPQAQAHGQNEQKNTVVPNHGVIANSSQPTATATIAPTVHSGDTRAIRFVSHQTNRGNQQKRGDDDQKQVGDAEDHWWTLTLADVLTLAFTAMGLIAVVATLRANSRSADAARDAALWSAEQQRPWLRVSNVNPSGLQITTDNNGLKKIQLFAHFNVENVGKTPARQISDCAVVWAFKHEAARNMKVIGPAMADFADQLLSKEWPGRTPILFPGESLSDRLPESLRHAQRVFWDGSVMPVQGMLDISEAEDSFNLVGAIGLTYEIGDGAKKVMVVAFAINSAPAIDPVRMPVPFSVDGLKEERRDIEAFLMSYAMQAS